MSRPAAARCAGETGSPVGNNKKPHRNRSAAPNSLLRCGLPFPQGWNGSHRSWPNLHARPALTFDQARVHCSSPKTSLAKAAPAIPGSSNMCDSRSRLYQRKKAPLLQLATRVMIGIENLKNFGLPRAFTSWRRSLPPTRCSRGQVEKVQPSIHIERKHLGCHRRTTQPLDFRRIVWRAGFARGLDGSRVCVTVTQSGR